MAGYSETPLVKKLGIKEDFRIVFFDAPKSFLKEISSLVKMYDTSYNSNIEYDYVHFFTKSKKELEEFFPGIHKHLSKSGMIWISWPKSLRRRDGGGERSRTTESDLNDNVIREIGLKNGLVDVKVAAIDDTWSGIKFVYRLKDR